jgi:hypothetical protein
MTRLSEYVKKNLAKQASDFSDEMRNVQKLRVRDKSDSDQKFDKLFEMFDHCKKELIHHQQYFESIA